MDLDGRYDLVYLSDEEIEKVEEYLDNIVPKYTDKNLKTAYVNNVEVSFKCKSYYMVSEKYKDMLKNKKYDFKW